MVEKFELTGNNKRIEEDGPEDMERRILLRNAIAAAGAGALLMPGAALAKAPEKSLRPKDRPDDLDTRSAEEKAAEREARIDEEIDLMSQEFESFSVSVNRYVQSLKRELKTVVDFGGEAHKRRH